MTERYVDQCMSRPVETVGRDTPVTDAAAELVAHGVGSLVVVDDEGRMEGLVTATDFVRMVRDGAASPDATVAEFMRTDVVTTTRQTPVRDVAATMVEHLVHHVPVVEDGEVVGMVSTLDLTASLAQGR